MVAYRELSEHYRLEDLGFRVPEGLHVVPPEAFAPVGEADRLLAEARERAAAIVRDAEAVREAERRKGFQEGLSRGQLQAAEQMLRQDADLDARLRGLERDIVNLVAACVRKLIDGFDVDARAMAAVRGGLKQMRRERKAELRVSPEQAAFFQASVSAIVADFPSFELIEIVEDPALSPPQVVIETAIGRVEGDLGARVAEFEGILRELAAGAFSAAEGDGERAGGGDDDR
ncbi:MAG: type III secretion system stator protein SctL [Pseudochelatococcus sp.]|uniref:type III secretion system stator protein SctL n=1 Tax=Pseudochelatococcus sp. TaxID=2020869 RepID=UPI003D8AC2B4